ncbi:MULTISPECIES: dephospho-CoA kinase [Oceanobacillus]|uniref:dephospho-CoA kinase n=1 Tax=Oceanobacillus TaxID=182709 RepID=UPI00062200D4|nr:dephospho-CoA kinase [Oceanobacillus caeni]KKE79037.1 dephospho-CoA kinase [Bacilli bacterium VT-13-104]PZD86272.1 dephospho-CoA kinase [Bacilli bacterium]MBU8789615.1 dephospho-CoA kinase [Oceanobacillus caeni]MED4476109.1 dephospho-CoA kinase [Oceanobacillus caeni]PZD87119.1 dephospho-CoA kinase [Bacilli bacterium]
MALIIGLTGSIASGKSTVSLMFDEFRIPVVDADKIAREVVYPGEEAYNKIIETFGTHLLREDKTLNRKKLGEIVFDDQEKLETLNQIVHPAIRKRIIEKRDGFVQDGASCVVLDIPLLFESNLTNFVDKTIVVYVDENVQLQRLMERDEFGESEALKRIKSQMPVKEKAKLADAVINNNSSKTATFEQLEDILRKWDVI